MKIICTEEEKKQLMFGISETDLIHCPCSPDCAYNCDECIESRVNEIVEWEITDSEPKDNDTIHGMRKDDG